MGYSLPERPQVSIPRDNVENTSKFFKFPLLHYEQYVLLYGKSNAFQQILGTNVPPSASLPIRDKAKSKAYSGKACQGLGKLLSLIRSDVPPVFERKKITKNEEEATAPRNSINSPEISTPILKLEPTKCPSVSMEGSTLEASIPDPDPDILGKAVQTPLKTLPEKNMRLCFQVRILLVFS